MEVRLMMTAATQTPQLPRMETRNMAHGKKRRKGMRLSLRLKGGQMTSDPKEYLIKDTNGEESALRQT